MEPAAEAKAPGDLASPPPPPPPPPDLKLVAHPRAKSKVWRYFGFDADAAGCILQWKRIYCRICRAQIAYSGNTSNLSYHLEKNHADEFCALVRSNTEQMREAFASAFSKLRPPGDAPSPPPPPAPQDRRQQDLTAAVLGLLCEGLHPVSLVEEPAFRALLRAADPWYELPGRKFFSKALPERYGAVRNAVRKDLAGAPWCAVSMELWRSHAQNRTYVTLAAHFLSIGGVGGGGAGGSGAPSSGRSPGYASRCLKTFEVPEENASETTARVLYEAFVEWGIGAKVWGATTDGGKDAARACALLDLPVHLRCLGRAFDAAIQRALRLPRLAALLARCRRLVAYFQQSPVARSLLLEKQRQQGLPRCMLVSDRVAWWGATLAMLGRLREQQFAVAAVLAEDSSHHHLMLDASEWAGVEGLVRLLEPFKQVAEMVCAPRHPTISMVKPLVHMLLGTTLSVQDRDPREVGAAKGVIAQELARTYRDAPGTDLFLNVATFLDPRYKKLPFLSALERQQVESRVLEEAKSLLENIQAGGPHQGAEEPLGGPPEEEEEEEEPPEKKPAPLRATPLPPPPPCATTHTPPPPAPSSAVRHMLAEIFCPAGPAEEQEELHAQVLEELSNYKSQKVLGLDGDPLRWWSERQALFPALRKVLQKYWCVPATCAPPGRLFGSAGAVVRAKRNRLPPAHVDEQVFLYENARGTGTGGAEPEPEDEDEGEWGLDHEPVVTFGDAVQSGFFGVTL